LRDLDMAVVDQTPRKTFDGILPVVAGSRRTSVNWQFAQVGRYSRQHEDHSYGDDQFPFSYPTLTDPISGRSSGILQRARDAGVCPKVLHLDTESDFWQARSSLIATDTSGGASAMPDEVRGLYGERRAACAVSTLDQAGHAAARQSARLRRIHACAAGRAVRVGGARHRAARQPLSVARRRHAGDARRGPPDIPPAAGSEIPELPERAAAAGPLG
jgi:hypothetical protein